MEERACGLLHLTSRQFRSGDGAQLSMPRLAFFQMGFPGAEDYRFFFAAAPGILDSLAAASGGTWRVLGLEFCPVRPYSHSVINLRATMDPRSNSPMKLRLQWKRGGSVDEPETPPLEPLTSDPVPQAFVDIHSHILWGIDDGSRSLEESLAMLKIAADNGTSDIVATPHANSQYKFEPSLIADRIAELRKHLPGLPRIHAGCDFHLNVPNVDDALRHPEKYTINGLSYLMVEFPDIIIPASSEEILRRLVAAGIIPVITHPERNPYLSRDLERLQSWCATGCLLQVTAQSVTGRFGKDAKQSAWTLLRTGMVHAVASDAHDPQDRSPRLDSAWRAVKQELGDPEARKLFIENPGTIIQGQPLAGLGRLLQDGAR